jgi:hypothetical protein
MLGVAVALVLVRHRDGGRPHGLGRVITAPVTIPVPVPRLLGGGLDRVLRARLPGLLHGRPLHGRLLNHLRPGRSPGRRPAPCAIATPPVTSSPASPMIIALVFISLASLPSPFLQYRRQACRECPEDMQIMSRLTTGTGS